ncbi:MAG: ClpXP protease specificity-enhancing factor SspB [Alphaproteobacteria bacterium]|nr:ClpXP protease specificity-enhancing factor SspB [Alphaproteobacteria bacterium]
MAQKLFNYEPLIEKALRGVIADTLSHVAKNNLLGEQHFYISFLTQYPGVEIPDYLAEEYPEEMTIVLQHQYFGLKVHADRFEVMLVFGSAPDKIVVPFEAITDFMDPSQRFELKFMPDLGDEIEDIEETKAKSSKSKATSKTGSKKSSKVDKEDATTPTSDNGNNVVTLDAFRKK